MPSKYGVIEVKAPIGEIWEKNRQFWAENRGKIILSQISDNGFLRRIEVKSTYNMHFYAFSFGEKYNFQFGYDPNSKILIIIIKVKFNIFEGRGFIWKIPQETIKKWTEFMGFQQIHLENKPSTDFLAAKEFILNINKHDLVNLPNMYCSFCGGSVNQSDTYCQMCGNNLKESSSSTNST